MVSLWRASVAQAAAAPILLLAKIGRANHPQVTTTQEGVETATPEPTQYLHPNSNALDSLDNPPTTMDPSISATTTFPSYLSEHTPLFLDYDSYISPSMF